MLATGTIVCMRGLIKWLLMLIGGVLALLVIALVAAALWLRSDEPREQLRMQLQSRRWICCHCHRWVCGVFASVPSQRS
jgi:hypothetical protein